MLLLKYQFLFVATIEKYISFLFLLLNTSIYTPPTHILCFFLFFHHIYPPYSLSHLHSPSPQQSPHCCLCTWAFLFILYFLLNPSSLPTSPLTWQLWACSPSLESVSVEFLRHVYLHASFWGAPHFLLSTWKSPDFLLRLHWSIIALSGTSVLFSPGSLGHSISAPEAPSINSLSQ